MHALFQHQASKEENVVIQHLPRTGHFKKENEQLQIGIMCSLLVYFARKFSGN